MGSRTAWECWREWKGGGGGGASKEIVWLTRVLTEAGLEPNSEVPLRSDNQAAIGCQRGDTTTAEMNVGR